MMLGSYDVHMDMYTITFNPLKHNLLNNLKKESTAVFLQFKFLLFCFFSFHFLLVSPFIFSCNSDDMTSMESHQTSQCNVSKRRVSSFIPAAKVISAVSTNLWNAALSSKIFAYYAGNSLHSQWLFAIFIKLCWRNSHFLSLKTNGTSHGSHECLSSRTV